MFPWKLTHLGKRGREVGHIKTKKRVKKIYINYCSVMLSWLLLASCLCGFRLKTQDKMGLAVFPAIKFSCIAYSSVLSRHRAYTSLLEVSPPWVGRFMNNLHLSAWRFGQCSFLQYTKQYSCHIWDDSDIANKKTNAQALLSWLKYQ